MARDGGHQHNHEEAQGVGDAVGGPIGADGVHDPCQAGAPGFGGTGGVSFGCFIWINESRILFVNNVFGETPPQKMHLIAISYSPLYKPPPPPLGVMCGGGHIKEGVLLFPGVS